jgi:hypothetical protein
MRKHAHIPHSRRRIYEVVIGKEMVKTRPPKLRMNPNALGHTARDTLKPRERGDRTRYSCALSLLHDIET